MELNKFIWIGKNRKFGDIIVSFPMTTTDLLERHYLSFFSLSNRDEGGNCEFMLECFENSYLKLSIGSEIHTLFIQFVGKHPTCNGSKFNGMTLEKVLNLPGFISIELEPF